MFPMNCEFGIKNPYMSVSGDHFYSLRNDNPKNIVFKPKELDKQSADPDDLKLDGNVLVKSGKF